MFIALPLVDNSSVAGDELSNLLAQLSEQVRVVGEVDRFAAGSRLAPAVLRGAKLGKVNVGSRDLMHGLLKLPSRDSVVVFEVDCLDAGSLQINDDCTR